MSVTLKTKFIVRKPFRYGKLLLQQGDEWKPTGGDWDGKIPDSGLVTVVHEKVEEPAPKPTTTRRRRKT